MSAGRWLALVAGIIIGCIAGVAVLDARAVTRQARRFEAESRPMSVLLAPATLNGSTWPTAADGRYDWAARNALNGATEATVVVDLAMPASGLSAEGTILSRDSASGIQRQIELTVTSAGAIIARIGSTLTGAWGQCTTPSSTLAASTRYRVAVIYDGLRATNATRLRVFTAAVDAVGVVGSPVEQTCTFAGTVPAVMTTPTTAAWSVGQRFSGTLGLRAATLYQIAVWSGIWPDPADALVEVMQARDLTATSLGPPIARYTFSGATVTEAVAQGAGGLTGTGPSAASAPDTRNRTAPTATPGCGVALSGTPGGTQTMTMATNGVTTTRSSLIVVPTSYVTTTPLPVIVYLHGCSYTAATLRTESLSGIMDVEPVVGTARAIHVYAQGLAGPKGDSYECPTSSQTGWTVTQSEANRDVIYMRRLIEQLRHRYCVDESRLYLVGRSMGAAGGGNIAAQMGPAIWRAAAVGAVTAGAPSPTPATAQWVLVSGNTGDPTAPIALARGARDAWSTANGTCTSTGTSSLYPDCTDYTCPSGDLTYCETAVSNHTPQPFVGEAIASWLVRRGL